MAGSCWAVRMLRTAVSIFSAVSLALILPYPFRSLSILLIRLHPPVYLSSSLPRSMLNADIPTPADAAPSTAKARYVVETLLIPTQHAPRNAYRTRPSCVMGPSDTPGMVHKHPARRPPPLLGVLGGSPTMSSGTSISASSLSFFVFVVFRLLAYARELPPHGRSEIPPVSFISSLTHAPVSLGIFGSPTRDFKTLRQACFFIPIQTSPYTPTSAGAVHVRMRDALRDSA
ncbi:hypothetical protein DFH08DRAFT_1086814 [Mycena albidolilacea]|uniref:Uncharacterized protein n=1 Tax=Mycena albidolilacea TaxID=1033008 RepID=A0AAD6ZCH4_9AGAR|nr:hypothetical protein DFH08DRAFT_1086814 [Mycena albidolilacea]